MELQFTSHAGKSVKLTCQQTEACRRYGDNIDIETPEGAALVPGGLSALIDDCIDDINCHPKGWAFAYRVGKLFLASKMHMMCFDWSDSRWLVLICSIQDSDGGTS